MREIETGLSTTNMVEVDTAIELREWLKQQAVLMQSITDKNCWLLAHCEDGVIWGELRDNGKLALSCEAFSSKHGLICAGLHCNKRGSLASMVNYYFARSTGLAGYTPPRRSRQQCRVY
jgi:hypothetical protein